MATLYTYEDINRWEDVEDMIWTITPSDKPFLSLIGRSVAENTIHFWPEYNLTTRQGNAQIEGRSWSYGTLTVPVKRSNITQILQKQWAISGSEAVISSPGIDSMVDKQRSWAVIEIGTDLEHAALRQSIASGTGSGARQMGGAMNYVTTTATAVASGTKLTESFFNGQLEACWLQGGNPDFAMLTSHLKRVADTFSYQLTKNIDIEKKRLTSVVDVIQSSFGEVKLVLSRDMITGTLAESMLIAETGRFSLANLRERGFHEVQNVPQDIDGIKGVFQGEYTLEVHNEAHAAKATGLAQSF